MVLSPRKQNKKIASDMVQSVLLGFSLIERFTIDCGKEKLPLISKADKKLEVKQAKRLKRGKINSTNGLSWK